MLYEAVKHTDTARSALISPPIPSFVQQIFHFLHFPTEMSSLATLEEHMVTENMTGKEEKREKEAMLKSSSLEEAGRLAYRERRFSTSKDEWRDSGRRDGNRPVETMMS